MTIRSNLTRSTLVQEIFQSTSTGIVRSIVEINEIQSDLRFTESVAVHHLAKQTDRLKVALKDVEKLRILWAESQKMATGKTAIASQSLSLELNSMVRNIQYEMAKVEVLEMMLEVTPNFRTGY